MSRARSRASPRWTRTATNTSTGAQGTPITLTWSFAPDSTLIPGNTTGSTVMSNLLATLDAGAHFRVVGFEW